jgi:hypothetical protein
MMKIDAYTRIVLTVIACALVVSVFQNGFNVKSATASGGVTRVAICDTAGQYCADVGREPKAPWSGPRAGISVFSLK